MDHFNVLPPQEQERIMQAVNKLCASNPDVVIQIEKLAQIKEENGLAWTILKSKAK